MTPDERTALNEAVCKRLGWVRLDDYHWQTIGAGYVVPTTQIDFTSDWNAVYRWLFAAVKGFDEARRLEFFYQVVALSPGHVRARPALLYATPEDYCRAFLAVAEVNDATS